MGSETVTMEDFENALKDTRASVTEAMERDYEKIQGEIKQAAMSVNPIGFFAPGMLKPVRERKHDDMSD
jgi:transitional endoplasmic reticulum ATPase